MKFDVKASHGKAGENYFAYWVSRNFGWPCRLFDIDIGIDAQIELINDECHSLGKFIAVQIKTYEKYKNPQVHLKNLEYWSEMTDPVIIVSISLEKDLPEVRWKLINTNEIKKYITQAKKNTSKKVRIKLSTKNILSLSCKEQFLDLHLIKLALAYDKKCKSFYDESKAIQERLGINNPFPDDPIKEDIDLISVDSYIEYYKEYFDLFDKVNASIELNPKILKHSKESRRFKSNHYKALKGVRNFISFLSEIDIDHNYEIRKRWDNPSNNQTLLEIFRDEYLLY